MVKSKIKFTYKDYKNLPESETKRYELLEGELVMVPSPTTYHQRISWNVGRILGDFVAKHDLGVIYHAPLDVVFSQEDVAQPDILFIPKAHSQIITDENIQGAPDLIIPNYASSFTFVPFCNDSDTSCIIWDYRNPFANNCRERPNL
jgi:Uma2 family endonuclease